jgi:hypothetical protein
LNAPAGIKSSSRDRYIPIVDHHCPGCSAEEKALRCSILFIRDKATAALRSCTEDAYGALAEASRLANAYAFRSMSRRSLKAIRLELQMLVRCASGLEAFHHSLGDTDEGV